MKSWLHGENPFESLRKIEIFEELKAEIKNGYLKQFIKEVLLDNSEKHGLYICLKKANSRKTMLPLQKRFLHASQQ